MKIFTRDVRVHQDEGHDVVQLPHDRYSFRQEWRCNDCQMTVAVPGI